MDEVNDPIPSLPTYSLPQGIRQATPEEQKPMMKMMGKTTGKRISVRFKNKNVHSQTVTIKQKKVKYW